MDIYTILSRRNLDILTDYWFQYGRPRDILFPSRFTGGYLTVSTPEQVISRKFRGKYMEELKRLWQDGCLVFGGTSEKYRNHYIFQELVDSCYKKEWVPHHKVMPLRD